MNAGSSLCGHPDRADISEALLIFFRHDSDHRRGRSGRYPQSVARTGRAHPGTKIDFTFVNGSIEIHLVVEEGEWETRHGISFPVPPEGAQELSTSEVRSLLEAVRDERADQAANAGS